MHVASENETAIQMILFQFYNATTSTSRPTTVQEVKMKKKKKQAPPHVVGLHGGTKLLVFNALSILLVVLWRNTLR